MRKFAVGQRYVRYSWFTGGAQYMDVKKVSGKSVYFKTAAHELDGNHTMTERYEICRDANGNESCVLFEYHGKKCVIEAQEMV